MNLNSYLGLLGKRLREVVRAGRLHLVECENEPAQLIVPDADYVITVDADSMLLGKYALNLTHIMSRPEAARFGVVQSPFSAVPGSPGTLERMAGAQTDVQWIASQGSTYFNASFWVGANALLRRTALEDICETVHERGYPIKRYIHDHTLVEDTESAIVSGGPRMADSTTIRSDYPIRRPRAISERWLSSVDAGPMVHSSSCPSCSDTRQGPAIA